MSVAFTSTQSAPDRTRAALGSIGSVSLFDRNNTIFAEGDEAEHVYKVVSGGVRLCKMLQDGRRQIVEFALPGDYFGIDWLERHALTAEAMVDTTTVCYGRGRLTRLGDENRDVRAEIFSTLRHDLWAAQNHLVILGRQSARERVAAFLLQLLERRREGAKNKLDLPMTRQDIADYLGLTIETVCRVLTALKREGVIDIPDRHSLTVRNAEALEDACTAED
ncbi:MAG: helix-turn-helix domain-containing protein [Proteobacteria bacterium]|nr:helix-turn-helix domain-containing protein [Pseudomonadota bacterium]